jgi:hypothetical protein
MLFFALTSVMRWPCMVEPGLPCQSSFTRGFLFLSTVAGGIGRSPKTGKS